MKRNANRSHGPWVVFGTLLLAGVVGCTGGEPAASVESDGTEAHTEDTRSGEGETEMRWKFGPKRDREYQDLRTHTIRRIDAWWEAFDQDRDKIVASFENGNGWDLPGWMSRHLHAIEPRLMWEFGPGVKGGHRLVITPEADRHLRPLLETILERAPRMEDWEFYPYRLAEGIEEAQAMLKARGLASISNTRVRATPGSHHQIDLEFVSPDYEGPDDQEALNSVFIATEVILGEEVLDTWIGEVSVQRGSEEGETAVELDSLRSAVDQEIARIRAKLPDKPAWDLPEDTEWTLWELKPEEDDDYPEQLDLFVARSLFPDMWSAAHAGAIFSSSRFTRFGEVFCYVKIDGSADLSGEKFSDKAEIEDALDAALKERRAGAVVGGGTGLRYSYIDLALSDVEAGIEQVVRVLQSGEITKRAWILFFDDIYRYEWIGIWDDSPTPPGME